jgi:hypothetical protein
MRAIFFLPSSISARRAVESLSAFHPVFISKFNFSFYFKLSFRLLLVPRIYGNPSTLRLPW